VVETHGQGSQNDRKYHGHSWITWFVHKEGAKPSDIIVYYVQYLDRDHLLAALCSTGYEAPTVASGQHRMLSVSGTTTHIKHAFVRPIGSSQ
jgi:hypothetical protein